MEFLHGGYVSDNIATFIKITLANPGTILAGKNQMLKGGIAELATMLELILTLFILQRELMLQDIYGCHVHLME